MKKVASPTGATKVSLQTNNYINEFNFLKTNYLTDTDAWSKLFPTCGGNRQSPININTTSVVNAMTYPLKFANYNVLTRNIVASFGHNGSCFFTATNYSFEISLQ